MAKGFLIAVALLLLVVGCILFAMPLLGVNLYSAEPKVSPGITILRHSGAIDPHSATYIVNGVAKNTGTTPVVKVYIVVTTYDETGAEIGSTYNTLMNLDPGDEVPFTVDARPYYNGIRVKTYNVVPNYNMVP